MKFELPDIHATLRDTVKRFSTEKVAPQVLAIEDAGAIPAEIDAQLREMDLWSLTLPEDRGGAELDALAYAVVVEVLASASPSLAHRYAVHTGPACHVLASTDLDLGEVAAGTLASWTDGGLSPTARSYWVRTTAEGAEILRGATAKPVATTGLLAAELAELVGGEVVAQSAESGRGWADLGIAACCVGAAQGALNAALIYAQERKQFGRSISNFQAIQFKLADAAMLVDASRLMLWRASLSSKFAVDAAAARVFAGRAAVKVASEALQIHGGYGYTREYPVERFLRAARQWSAQPDGARETVALSCLG